MGIEEFNLILKAVEGATNGAVYIAICYMVLSYLKVATVCGAILYGVLKVADHISRCDLASAEVQLERAKTEWRHLQDVNNRVAKLEREVKNG